MLKEAELVLLGPRKALQEANMSLPVAALPVAQELPNKNFEALTLPKACNLGTSTLQEPVHSNEMRAQKQKKTDEVDKQVTSFQKDRAETETRLHGHAVLTHWHDNCMLTFNYPYILQLSWFEIEHSELNKSIHTISRTPVNFCSKKVFIPFL